jgi:HK97 gp10 family phage protein
MADSTVEFRSIKGISKLLKNGNDNILLTLAIAGSSQAKLLSPVAEKDGGMLRNSINYRSSGGEKGGLNDSKGTNASNYLSEIPKDGEAFVGATAEYGGWVEFGTRKMAPQAYLRPSIALVSGQAPKVVKEKMDAEFKKGPLYGEERIKF